MNHKTITAARISMVMSVVTIILLLSLHLLSREFDPSWRMVSEYALGNYNRVLLMMFVTWAFSSWTLAYAIRQALHTRYGKTGRMLLIISGFGMLMGGVFPIPHPLHGPAALIGLPSFCVAAILVTNSLRKTEATRHLFSSWPAHLPWVSLVLLAVTMGVMIAGFIKSGVDMSSGQAPERLPDGVIGLVGYVNRFLIIAYCYWTWSTARQFSASTGKLVSME